MDSDEEDFVFYGTPIEREEEITGRKKKAVAEASGNLRSLPPWKQEVRDEEGRRRFHGAFTGGFSAGYYNSVGSKEGWAPQSFTSSRKNRAEVKQQDILNFLDEDEKAELESRSLGTSLQFDTFGFTATELARKQAEKEQKQRPSAIPGPVPDEIVVPTAESIGVKLLLKMGWRHGRSIKDSQANSLYDARREARKALLAFSSGDAKSQIASSEPLEGDIDTTILQPAKDDVQSSQSTPDYVINPKQDSYGLGFDPYKHAPEFRDRKKARAAGGRESSHRKSFATNNLFGFKSGKVASGFGIGALEELDVEDEDVYSGYDFEETYVQEPDEPSGLIADDKPKLTGIEQSVLRGFRVASNSDYQLERFDPPVISKDFVPRHTFAGPLETDYKLGRTPPVEVPPPDDSNLKLLIEGVAALVARCGNIYEDLSREKNQSNPLFKFLIGGNGHEYYERKLWEERRKRMDQTKHIFDGKLSAKKEKMTAESRGKILGERPLERNFKDSKAPTASTDVQLQFNLSDTFTTPASFNGLPEVIKPFKDDPAKQERFESFLKEKYQGGLRSTDSGGASNMSEAVRARERLDFEAAADAMKKGNWGKEAKASTQQFMNFLSVGALQFTSGGLEQDKNTKREDLIAKKMRPKREEFQWRPSPILCKRFDLIDPYMGKPPPAPRMKSKIDSLIFTSDSVKFTKVEESLTQNSERLPMPQSDTRELDKDADKDTEVEVEVENVERPVDLYKAIFSDSSDDEGEASSLKRVENPEKKTEVANTMLNRLIAGDFLESLGKELGLEVPPDLPPSVNKASAPQKETGYANPKNSFDVSPGEDKSSSTLTVSRGTTPSIYSNKAKVEDGELARSKDIMEIGPSENKLGKVEVETIKAKRHLSRHLDLTSSSSEDERRRKRSRQHLHRSSDSESDDQDEYRHSRSKGRKKGSSREKSSRRKHSKHRKDRSRDDHYGSRDRSDSKRDRRK